MAAALAPGSETDVEVSVAGRVLRLRDSGKLIFATLADRGADVQLFVSKGDVGDTAFADIKSLDRGDWVGVRGRGDDDARR